MSEKMVNLGQFILLTIFLAMNIISHTARAEQYSNDYYNHLTPQHLIDLLNKSQYIRENHISKYITGQIAPPINVENWLVEPQPYKTWPTGLVTILEFWSINCGPCVSHIPENNELAKWLKKNGGQFISIHSTGESLPHMKSFIEKHPVKYPIALDTCSDQKKFWRSETFRRYGVNALPEYVTIGKNGQVLSYCRPEKEYLKELLETDRAILGPVVPIAHKKAIMVAPDRWFIYNLEPGSKVFFRCFVYYPDATELILEKMDYNDEIMDIISNRYSDKRQTVYELRMSSTVPNWGEELRGEIEFTAKYFEYEKIYKLPYEISARNIAECEPSVLFFGQVDCNKTAVQIIKLQLTKKHCNAEVKFESVPSEITVNLSPQDKNNSLLIITATFCSHKTGMHNGVIRLAVSDNENNMQSISLRYVAFVSI